MMNTNFLKQIAAIVAGSAINLFIIFFVIAPLMGFGMAALLGGSVSFLGFALAIIAHRASLEQGNE